MPTAAPSAHAAKIERLALADESIASCRRRMFGDRTATAPVQLSTTAEGNISKFCFCVEIYFVLLLLLFTFQ